MVKVSVIMPVYNAGFRINECIETLVNQTLKEIEIICVLDLPTDGTDKILEEYAKKDSRIKLIYNEKSLHVSGSRNRGIAAATGEYIGFSDHDDTRKYTMYEKLYEEAKKNNYDIVVSDCSIRRNGIDEIHHYGNSSWKGIVSSLVSAYNYPENLNKSSSAVWASVFKRSLILDNQIEFVDRRVCLEEDRHFNLKAFLRTSSISYIPEQFYVWNKYDSSLSEQWGTDEANTRLSHFELLTTELKETGHFQTFKKEWNSAVEESLWEYLVFFKVLKTTAMNRLCKILVEGRFPVFGKYQHLKLISKKRFNLILFVTGLYLRYFKLFITQKL